MADLDAGDFPEFFDAVNGYEPFAWQAELARRVLGEGGWPECIDVPTGLGKTALLEIAVFALAAESHLPPAERSAPTRTFIVVDRRLIVDQTFDRAQKLQRCLEDRLTDVVARVSASLVRIAGESDTPLEVVRMRGGLTWESQWLSSPDQPAVVVGTVDQYGSRALFRGYGVSAKRRPIDAALTASDALLVLDEAHMSQPLVKTMRAVHAYEAAAERSVLGRRRHRPVLLSATLPDDLHDVFRPDPSAETSSAARARLDAVKRVALVELKTRAKDPTPDLAAGLATLAVYQLEDPAIERRAVVCNTVAAARATFSQLEREKERGALDADLALLIGRCRDYERRLVAAEWEPRLRAEACRTPNPRPVIVVATQTIEVGADFDFDLVVTEAAPVDALLQRLGRLNRLGLRESADAIVVYVTARHDDDPVYGSATKRTWDWLVQQTSAPQPTSSKDVIRAAGAGPSLDLGPLAVNRILPPDVRGRLSADAPESPEIIGPTIAAWARTEPAPDPDQPVAPFLHGFERASPEVLVCWRALPPVTAEGWEEWEGELRMTPPASGELVTVPIWEARRFLSGQAPGSLADVEGAEPDDDDFDDPLDERIPVPFAVVAADGVPTRGHVDDLRPGAMVVVRSEDGGHDAWGWTGRLDSQQPTVDVADLQRSRQVEERSSAVVGHCRRLRLRPYLLDALVGRPDRTWAEIVAEAKGSNGEERGVDAAATWILEQVTRVEVGTEGLVSPQVRELARQLLASSCRARKAESTPEWYVVESMAPRLPEVAGDDGEAASSAAWHPVGLGRHLLDVGALAGTYARRLGLPDGLARAVELAGLAHDLGKSDPRFQAMLHGGDRLRAEAWPELLAKSGMASGDRRAFRRARESSGWPEGMRHESISAVALAQMAEATPGLGDGLDTTLVFHLVASHHGHSRPLLPAVVDDDPRVVSTELPEHGLSAKVRSDEKVVDWSSPARFELLNKRYGWWGLALLETIVRLADIACSKGYEARARS